MIHEDEKRIDLYLSGRMEREKETQTENAMLKDSSLLNHFIEAVERSLCPAPFGFADSVMRAVSREGKSGTVINSLSRKMRAAVCFCSAAAIIAITVSGFDRLMLDFIADNFDRLNEALNTVTIKIL